MTLETTVSLTIALLVFAATPGPGNFAVAARALSGGMGAAAAMIAGIALGDLLFLAAALAGITSIGPILQGTFVIVKYIGAAYLFWLGVRLWRQAPQSYEPGREREKTEFLGGIAAGFLLTLGNPKVIFFYLGLLPLFVDPDRFSTGDAMILAIVVPATISLPLVGYAKLAVQARRYGPRPSVLRSLNRAAGSLLIGAGITIAAKQ